MNPISASKLLANLLDTDPVAAAQIKEHLKPERILELLDLPAAELETYLRVNHHDLQRD